MAGRVANAASGEHNRGRNVLFDVIVMSDEMARALTADTVAASRSVEVVHREG